MKVDFELRKLSRTNIWEVFSYGKTSAKSFKSALLVDGFLTLPK